MLVMALGDSRVIDLVAAAEYFVDARQGFLVRRRRAYDLRLEFNLATIGEIDLAEGPEHAILENRANRGNWTASSFLAHCGYARAGVSRGSMRSIKSSEIISSRS